MVGRHRQRGEIMLESLDLEPVGGHAANENDRIQQLPVCDYGAHVIGGVAEMQAGYDVGQTLPLVLEMDHVRFCKNRATAGDRSRVGVLQTQFDKVVQGLLQLFLSIEKSGR